MIMKANNYFLYNNIVIHNYVQGSWTDWVQNGPDETKHLGVKGEDLQSSLSDPVASVNHSIYNSYIKP